MIELASIYPQVIREACRVRWFDAWSRSRLSKVSIYYITPIRPDAPASFSLPPHHDRHSQPRQFKRTLCMHYIITEPLFSFMNLDFRATVARSFLFGK